MKNLRTILILLALPTIVACTEDDPCDSNTQLVMGTCVPAMADAGPTADAASTSPDATAVSADFGDECVDGDDHSDCGGPTDYCAVGPGGGTGYCTASGCDAEPSICPDGWGCFDLSIFQDGLPFICTEPS